MNCGTFASFRTLENLQTLEIFQTFEKIFKDFFDKNVFPDDFFFQEFFIAFKTITLYKRDMYVFAYISL